MFAKMSRQERLRFLELRTEAERRAQRNRLQDYKPYPRQKEFHAAGAIHRERLLMAANQVGKTLAGSAETAYHLTGRYPLDWPGKQFYGPVRGWAASKTGEVTRDTVQRLLVGEPKDESQWGTGWIPGDQIVSWGRKHGVKDSIDNVVVQHVSGGKSTLGFKSYDQDRQQWQGETLHFVWFDEEPPPDIYSEGLTRTNAVMGIVFLTFTPLLGHSKVVQMFVDECGLGEN